jgi:hypothetical protein
MNINIEIISAFVGLLLTLMVFSYWIGDNPLFRFAIYLFIGVSSGYAAAVILRSVFLPKYNLLQSGDFNRLLLEVIVPILFSVTVFAKLFPRTSWIGNFAMAVLVGVGAAAAVGGALIGTLLPQAQAAMNAFDLGPTVGASNPVFRLLEGTVMLVGTVLTLASFHFSVGRAPDGTPKRIPILDGIASLGRIFVAITLGVLFAGVYVAALTALIERLSSMITFIRQLIGI